MKIAQKMSPVPVIPAQAGIQHKCEAKPLRYRLYRATKVTLVRLDPSFTQLKLIFNQDEGSYGAYLW
ncbi:MAG: hypothetical protein KBB83_01500 [Alphaproteobacteria bacterium]|nr:hypothetical protein [Alphaproteobacteria bacterium]